MVVDNATQVVEVEDGVSHEVLLLEEGPKFLDLRVKRPKLDLVQVSKIEACSRAVLHQDRESPV